MSQRESEGKREERECNDFYYALYKAFLPDSINNRCPYAITRGWGYINRCPYAITRGWGYRDALMQCRGRGYIQSALMQ